MPIMIDIESDGLYLKGISQGISQGINQGINLGLKKVHPENSYDELEKMVNNAETVIAKTNIFLTECLHYAAAI